jgi:hypothetical protein
MAALSRARTSTGAGTLAILVLVLAFGNQAFTEWVARHAQGANSWDRFLRALAWPDWNFSGGRTAFAHDLRALLLVVFVAGILAAGASSYSAGASAFFIGWFATILGAALAAMLTALLLANASLYSALGAAAGDTDPPGAATYGLFVGWIVGIAAAAGARRSGP